MKATNRTKTIRLRVTSAEKSLIEERAKTAGLTASEYVRREAGIGHYGTTDLRRAAIGTAGRQEGESTPGTAGVQESPDHEARVRELTRRMPRRNAETQVRREKARERAAAKARAARGSV